MNELNDIGESLEASLAKDTLVDIMSGLGDSSIEMLLELADGIPFFSYFTKGVKATQAVRDFIFLEKVIEFLTTVGETPTDQRSKMIEQIQSDPKYNEKFGKVSLIAIDRYDDKQKAKLLGQAAKYLARGEINFVVYKRISFIIGRLYIDDIFTFANNDRPKMEKFASDLESLGLAGRWYTIKEKFSDSFEAYQSSPNEIIGGWQTTILGKAIQSIILEKPLNSINHYLPMSLSEFCEKLNKQYG